MHCLKVSVWASKVGCEAVEKSKDQWLVCWGHSVSEEADIFLPNGFECSLYIWTVCVSEFHFFAFYWSSFQT